MPFRCQIMAKTIAGIVATIFFVAPSVSARADNAGDRLLAEMDTALNRATTLTLEYEVVNREPGKEERKLAMSVRLKGEKRLTEFSAPADMKGTKVLILSPTQIWVFLPAFGKVRRFASHVGGGFLGLAFSADDMATTSYSADYSGQIASETATERRLIATPKASQGSMYSKIEFLVSRNQNLPLEIKYFNAAGANDRTETRTRYTCEGNVCNPGELKMTDNITGHWTKLIRSSWKVNETIADDVFSKSSLGE
jgi:hypothetical protein